MCVPSVLRALIDSLSYTSPVGPTSCCLPGNSIKSGTVMKTLVSALLLFSCTVIASAQPITWLQNEEPLGGGVRQIASDSSGNHYALSMGGLFRSTNGGTHWSRCVGTGNEERFEMFAVAGDGDLYAGSWTRGIYRSSDDGSTWIRASDSWPSDAGYYKLSVSPVDEEILMATGSSIRRSTDFGATWVPVAPHGAHTLRHLADGSVLVASDRSILRATDDRSQFDLLFEGASVASFIETSAGAILALTLDAGVLRSTDRGQSWHRAHEGLPFGIGSWIELSASGDIFYGTNTLNKPVWRSADDGTSWHSVELPSNVRASMLHAASDGALLLAADHDILRSTDRGVTWTSSGSGINSPYMAGILDIGDGVLFAAQGRGKLHRSTDRGRTWSTELQ